MAFSRKKRRWPIISPARTGPNQPAPATPLRIRSAVKSGDAVPAAQALRTSRGSVSAGRPSASPRGGRPGPTPRLLRPGGPPLRGPAPPAAQWGPEAHGKPWQHASGRGADRAGARRSHGPEPGPDPPDHLERLGVVGTNARRPHRQLATVPVDPHQDGRGQKPPAEGVGDVGGAPDEAQPGTRTARTAARPGARWASITK
jgi:hypothetical protein